MTSDHTDHTDYAAALRLLGNGSPHPIARLAEAILNAAAAELLEQLDDDHPDHPAECSALMAEVVEAVEDREELPSCVEGWEYWFGCSQAFRAYEAARELWAAN